MGEGKTVQWVIKLFNGRINEAQANYILLGFAVLTIIVSLFLFFGGNNSQRNQEPMNSWAEEAGGPADITP